MDVRPSGKRAVLLATLLAAVALPALGAGQDPPQAPQLLPGVARLRQKVNPEYDPWSPEYLYERVAEHLATVEGHYLKAQNPHTPEQWAAARKQALHEVSYLCYFSLAEVPRANLPEAVASLFFTINSASPAAVVVRPRAVPNTDNRLFFMDVRWAYWTREAVEKVSLEDFYYREPILPSESKALNYIRERIGNRVLRGDWLSFYAGDSSLFLSKGGTQADSAFYYRLL